LLTEKAVAEGVLIRLNQEKLPGCYYHRSNSNDVARVEQCTYICTEMEEEAGPTNNWVAPKLMYAKLRKLCEALCAVRCTSSPTSWDRPARRSPRLASS
jgi:phosphoenolpyruvate carboxykinase (GTP)